MLHETFYEDRVHIACEQGHMKEFLCTKVNGENCLLMLFNMFKLRYTLKMCTLLKIENNSS